MLDGCDPANQAVYLSRHSTGLSHRNLSLMRSLVVVVADVILYALFDRSDAVIRLKVAVLGVEGAEEALDHRVVKVFSFSTHALFDSVKGKHCFV